MISDSSSGPDATIPPSINPPAASGFGLFFPGAYICNTFMGGCQNSPNAPVVLSLGVYGIAAFFLFRGKL